MAASVPVEGNFPLDLAVSEVLPSGTRIISANEFGSSAWTVTAQIDTILPDGKPKKYFLKCAKEERGRIMMYGEFNSMQELYKTMPELVPEPYAWGKFKLGEPPTHFFLCDFIDMHNKLPEPKEFNALITRLHDTSVSPTGMFGFHVPTCHGKFAQVVNWDPSWTSFFTKLFVGALELDRNTNGAWPELDRLSSRTVTHVIPRLLGALESQGRTVKPCLIHGDLWDGNIGIERGTGKIFIFDAGSYYAHNEMEIGMWRCVRHRISHPAFRKEYWAQFPASPPTEEWDDRNRIYCVKMNLVHSAHHMGDIVRQTAYDDLQYLVEKYAPFSEVEGTICPSDVEETDSMQADGGAEQDDWQYLDADDASSTEVKISSVDDMGMSEIEGANAQKIESGTPSVEQVDKKAEEAEQVEVKKLDIES